MRLSIVLIILISWGCKPAYQQKSIEPEIIPLGDNSRTSLDWPGTYQGTIPCADCSGIKTQIKLNIDNTYELRRQYVGKDNEIIIDKGAVFWDATGSNITLDIVEDQFKVGENRLFKLDKDGNAITGDLASEYQLLKVDNQITNRNWSLTSLYGNEVSKDSNATLLLTLNNKASGNSGCNSFNATIERGTYKMLKFSGIFSTRKMCQNSIEDDFLKMLESTTKYELNNNSLILSDGEKEIARFKSEFF